MHILKSQELPRNAVSQQFEERLAELSKNIENPAHGFFGPGSMSWKIFRQPGLAIGGYRALLLQIAHPAVAAGVDRYSNFRRDTYGRAKRTYEAMMRMVFGDVATAGRMAKQLYQIHLRIRGTYSISNKTVHYRASDPDLLIWVLATILDSALLAYEMIYPPLSEREKNDFYEESKTLAILLGIPMSCYPENFDAFRRYFSQMVKDGKLSVGTTAQALADDIIGSIIPLRPLAILLAAQLLPDQLRQAFGFRASTFRQHTFMILLAVWRFTFPRLPSAMWAPPYHQAMYRIARQEGIRPPLLARMYHWLGSSFRFPATAEV